MSAPGESPSGKPAATPDGHFHGDTKRSAAASVANKVRSPLRGLTVELLFVILAKVAFLMLIWWLLFAPHPRPDASADALARRLAPASAHPDSHP